jgi:cell division protein FtsI/penicillin-binding protein 2/cell division protein FtsW (lipid II flippase)
MAVTKSWEATLVRSLERSEEALQERRRERIWLTGASLIVGCGLVLVYLAKTQDFGELATKLERGQIVNLNTVRSPAQLVSTLSMIRDLGERERAGEAFWEYIERHRPLPNVGALVRAHVNVRGTSARSLLAKWKPLLVVRTPAAFLHPFLQWCLLYMGSFWAVHFLWRWRKFRGDPGLLPALHLLTGIGLILMVSLRDPLRDMLEFRKFAWGVVIGCAILLAPLLKMFQYHRFSRWIYTPLLAALSLFLALLCFGSGPTGSDAKVNLGPFQPVEIIKILLIFFLAGYFAAKWEWLREVQQKRFVPDGLRWLDLPRLGQTLPVICGVSCALLMFFLLKDMGPALVSGFLFLLLFAVARGRAGLVCLGIATLVCGVMLGYHFGAPHTLVERVSMWLSPWDNDVRGGDQLAHSLWAFATGGPWGSGPGWGDASLIPAGHTDLVLPAIAEEWGLPGVIIVFLLFALLVHRAFCIALRACDDYGMFLAAGLGTLIALEMLLISGGALGAIPLSGVVSPFLSSGNTAMLANFFLIAVLLSISHQSAKEQRIASSHQNFHAPFRIPMQAISWALAACGLMLLARSAYIECVRDRDLLIRDAFVFTHDGVKRPEHNPRLNLLAASIPRGDIYDRNGILLVTSSWDKLLQHRGQYQKLGISLDQCCSPLDVRFYPFGSVAFHLLGDLRTGEKFHASNASLIEHDENVRLQGYGDLRELAPLVRYRHQRENPKIQALLARNRDVRSTIDIRLQVRVSQILGDHLGANGKGAAVVMNPSTGDVLALVSWPQPPKNGTANEDELLDRARYGEYPPGSTFKLVTAMAALRLHPEATHQIFACRRLPDGRAGTIIAGWRRPVRDDVADHPHGELDLAQAITVSCNAYFAQLGVREVGAQALHDTAETLGIPAGGVNELKAMLPFAAYGQGPVVATPFQMARVAATIAADGYMPQGRWVGDESNSRNESPRKVLGHDSDEFLQRAMRSVVTSGTARTAMAGLALEVAGKTGTAQLNRGQPHSWFAGFAPFDASVKKRIAFAVLVEHGGYGAKAAAPIAREIVEVTAELGIIGRN